MAGSDVREKEREREAYQVYCYFLDIQRWHFDLQLKKIKENNIPFLCLLLNTLKDICMKHFSFVWWKPLFQWELKDWDNCKSDFAINVEGMSLCWFRLIYVEGSFRRLSGLQNWKDSVYWKCLPVVQPNSRQVDKKDSLKTVLFFILLSICFSHVIIGLGTGKSRFEFCQSS